MTKKSSLNIALAGLGTVGSRVVTLLEERKAEIALRCGCEVSIVAVSARNRHRDRDCDLSPYEWYDDPVAMAGAEKVDLVVELIGGADGPALALSQKALEAGKALVTANKAMLSTHGEMLTNLAEKNQLPIGWEAAVMAGTPVVKLLRDGLVANRFDRICGIFNGTCNYILSEMAQGRGDFNTVLARAQEEGYAEADPSVDIDGFDAAHKTALLASLAFGTPPTLENFPIEGIGRIDREDMEFAEKFGFAIKLLGVAWKKENAVRQMVYPALVSRSSTFGVIEGTVNAVVIEADIAGPITLEGRGAGSNPTASAVVNDIFDVARGHTGPVFSVPHQQWEKNPRIAEPDDFNTSYYMRVLANDEPGVMAKLAGILHEEDISIENILQEKQSGNGEPVSVVLLTHQAGNNQFARALERIDGSDVLRGRPCFLRIEKNLG